ncbi:ABC transporter permease [Nocardioides albus]|uniref:Transport permease protein n=1 Tax=Nocardioides albus TaxID=1841 RepID=A0A7W5A5X5_9ACTN|nr:ABC transporter permease [Nocardioides albus]MBB3090298.1 ABC-2 type transport system permease protein [Nocardioides albus]GGU29130.1 transport permease protein [Nocardioides albus]
MTSPTAAVIRTESRLFARERLSLFWIVLFPSLLLGVLGLIPSFREESADLGGRSLIDLYVPVTVLLSMIMASIMTMPATLTGYRESGILRRLGTTPARPSSILLGQVLVHAAAVAASSVIVVLLGRVAFGTPLPGSIAGYAVAYVLALLVSLGIGAAITAASPNAKTGQVVGMVAFFPCMFTAGVYFPVEVFGGTVRDVISLTPYGAASNALNDATGGSFPELVDLAVMGGWAVVLYLIAVRIFRWE